MGHKRHNDLHHRHPRSKHGGDLTPQGRENVVEVDIEKHREWHRLFQNWLPPDIASLLNKLNFWASPDWTFVAVPKHKGEP